MNEVLPTVLIDTWHMEGLDKARPRDGWYADVMYLETDPKLPLLFTTGPHSSEAEALLVAEAWCLRQGYPPPFEMQ